MVVNRRRRDRRRVRRRVERPLRDYGDPLAMGDDLLFQRYRFRRPTLVFLLTLIGNQLGRLTLRNSALPPVIQLLTCLRFLATGTFYSVIGDTVTLCKASVFRCVRDVSNVLCGLSADYIKMPVGEEANKTKQTFYDIAGFPNVLGCVDGTFIRIMCPKDNEGDYLNRKGFHSLNVMMICNPDYTISNCVIKWPGSVHDSRIFRQSAICTAFENGTHSGFLLGDSGYGCRQFLLTPYLNPHNASQQRYNKAHCRTRVKIEQSFGIMKRRFACLHYGLRTNPQRSCQIILACVILHNIGILKHDIVNVNFVDSGDVPAPLNVQDDWSGQRTRDHVANTFFA